MPPRRLPKRDPKITRITRADARANAAVQAAVNATALASRGLAELPTAEETAAVEASVVDDRNNRPPPSPKPKRTRKKPIKVTKVTYGPKKKESKKAKFERRQKEKAEADKKAEEAEKAKAIEDVEAAKAIAAVEAAKAAEVAKEAKENGGEGGPIENEAAKEKGGEGGSIENDTSSSEEIIESSDDDKKGKTTKNYSHKDGGLGQPFTAIDFTSGRSGGSSPEIRGTELQRRLEGVEWSKLGEKLSAELFDFVRAGGSVDEWEKKRAEKEQLEKLTEQIGYVSSEEETLEDYDSEDDNGEYEDPEGETDPEAEEIVDGGDSDENDVYEDAEGGETEPEAKKNARYGPKVIFCPGPRRGPETEEYGSYDPGKTFCPGPSSSSENGNETETESDPGIGGEEKYSCSSTTCSGDTDTDSGSEGENIKMYLRRWHCLAPLSSPTSKNQTAQTQLGGSNTKSPGSDAKKSAGNIPAGKKRKPEGSPEQKPKKKTKLDEDSSGTVLSCSWRRGYNSNRGDKGERKFQLQNPPKKKNSSGTKSKGDELPKANPSNRGRRGVKIITPPKKIKRNDGIICALPERTPKKGSLKKHKSNESAEKKTSKKTIPDEEPERSKEGGGKKVEWLW